MKSRVILPLIAFAAIFALTADVKAGLLDRMLGGGCCQSSCCEATCCAAEPACGCAHEPTCGCAPACCDNCCDNCCRWTPVRDFLGNIRCRLSSLRDRCRTCCNSCCEASCGCAHEPACGCAAAPTCGCAK